MLRAIIVLGMMASANGDCALDSSSAVAHGIQSALNVWAVTKRCTGAVFEEAGVKCEQDIAAAIQTVTAMANDIAGMVLQCDDLQRDNHKCARLVTGLVSKTAGLAADGGFLADHCGKIVPKEFAHNVLGKATMLGMCTVNSGAALNSLFKADKVIKGASQNCGGDGPQGAKKCTTSSLNVVAVLANLGAFLSASVAKCNTYSEMTTHHNNDNVNGYVDACATGVLHSIADLAGVAQIGLQLKDACQVSDARLFIENGSDEVTQPAGINPVVFGLAAMVPIAAVLSFVAGSKFAKARQQSRAYDPVTLQSQQALNVE